MAASVLRLRGYWGSKLSISFRAVVLIAGFLLGAPAGYAATSAVGTAPGQFSVSPTGAATYQIPIAVPPGTNGLKPSLALLYNSQAGNGLLGMGWSLSGLSVISRCPQTIDQDNAVHLPNLTSADRFCLDGQRLIVTSGTYGASGSVYHTEIDSFQKVTAVGTAGTGPASFTVVDRAGLTRVYSDTVTGGDGSSALVWLISEITDRFGNYIKFHYSITSAAPPYTGAWDAVSKINYGNASGNTGIVLFTYNNGGSGRLRDDIYTQYAADTLVTVNAEALTGITVEDGSGTVLNTYNLGYQFNSPGPTVLTSVQECGSNGACYPASSFGYSGGQPGFGGGSATFANVGGPGNYQVADFDGDGLPDYVYATNGAVYVSFGNRTGALVSVPLASSSQAGIGLQGAVAVDLNGDGHQELLVPYYPFPGSSPDTPYWEMLVWNGKTGAAANLTLESPTPLNNFGQDMKLAICEGTDMSCSADATPLDIGSTGQSGLLFATAGQIYFYQNLGPSQSGARLNSMPVTTGITYTDIKTNNEINGHAPSLTPVNYSGTGLPEVYVEGTGVMQLNPATGKVQVSNYGDFNETGGFYAFFIDADGSGLSSAVMVNPAAGTLTYYPNTGSGFTFYSNNPTNNNTAYAPSGADLTQIHPVDWFGDGRQELVVPVNGGNWWLFEPSLSGSLFVNTGIAVMGSPTQFIDLNGDGAADMLYLNNSKGYVLYNTGTRYLLNSISNGLGHNTDVGYIPLDQAVNGAYVAGLTSSAINAPQVRNYMGPMYVVNDFAVDTGLFNASGAEQLYTYYLYAGAAIDQWGRGFLGFSQVEAINYNSGLYTTDTYRQDFPFAGMVATSTKSWDPNITTLTPASVGAAGATETCVDTNPAEPFCKVTNPPAPPKTAFVTGGDVLSVTTNSYKDDINPYNSVYYPYQNSSDTALYELGSAQPYENSSKNLTYQAVASDTPIGVDIMPTDVTVTTQDKASSGDVATVDTQSSYAQESTCPGHSTSVTVTHTFPKNTSYPSQTETFGYDGNCFLTSDVKNIIDSTGAIKGTLTKAYTPDGFGNPLTSTVSGTGVSGLPTDSGVTGRETKMTYDSTNRFPVTITNALTQTETLSYDSWGNKLTDTDANGNTVSYHYDGFERKTKQSGPLPAVYTKWAYGTCGSNCAATTAYQVTQTGSDGSSATTQYDELGRVTRNSHLDLNGITVNQDIQYDLMGRVTLAGAPTKNAHICWDLKQYDVLNRVQTEYQPLDSSQCDTSGSVDSVSGAERKITTGYDGFTTTRTIYSPSGTASPPNEATVTTLNVLGKPASVTDEGGAGNTDVTTSYTYDPWGNLASVTPPDKATVSMTYDSAGDKLTMQDPDMGGWSYSYDAAGELLSQTDAKGQVVNNTYDALGRLVRRDELEGETRWVYDIAYGAGVGRLAYTLGPLDSNGNLGSNGVWEGYAYDAYGEPTDKITVAGGREYWVTTTYTNQGQVAQVVYPNLTAVAATGTPAVPSGLGVTVDPDNGTLFNLTWALAQDGEIYHLYRTPSTVTQPSDAYEIYSGPVPNWQDSTITKDDTYTWWLKACNDTNCSGYAPISLNVILPPTVAGAPQSLQQDSHQQSIKLTWAGSASQGGTTGAITYNVYSVFTPYGGSTPSAPNEIAPGVADSGSGTTSTTVTLSQDGTYVFTVRACQGSNNACAAASGTMIYSTVLAPSYPGAITAPTPINATSSPASIPVNWSAPSFAGEPINQLIYELQVENTSSDGSSSFADTASQPSTALALNDSQTLDGEYLYRVRACDSHETNVCSPYTQVSGPTAVTLPPSMPGAISFYPPTDLHGGIWEVNWVASALNTGSTSSIYYNVEVSRNSTTAFGGMATYTKNTTDLLPQNKTNGTYYYIVQACDLSSITGNTACTPYSNPSPGYNSIVAPPAPTNVAHTAVSWNGSFSFTMSENAGGIAVTYYEVLMGEHDGETNTDIWGDFDCTNATTTCPVPGGLSPMAYIYEARACDTSVACSPWVPESAPYPKVVVTELSPPTAPSLSSSTTSSLDGNFTLSWTAPTTTTNYQVWLSTSSGSSGFFEAYSETGSPPPTSQYVGGALKRNYWYYVVACNQAGCSGHSNTVEVSVTGPAGPVVSLPSSVQALKVTVSWTSSSTATSYALMAQYCSPGCGNYGQVYSGTALQYTDNAPAGSETGNYYAIACNHAGCNGGWGKAVQFNPAGGGGVGGGCKTCAPVAPSNPAPSSGTSSGPSATAPSSGSTPPAGGPTATVLVPLTVPFQMLSTVNDPVLAVAPPGGTSGAAPGISGTGPMETSSPEAEAGPAQKGARSNAFAAHGAVEFAMVKPQEERRALSPIASGPELGLGSPLSTLAYPPSVTNTADVRVIVQPGAVHGNDRLIADAIPQDPKQAYFLSHGGLSTKPRSTVHATSRLAYTATARYAPPIDPRLSMYPPLRRDPRVQAHFEASGGYVAGTIQKADCGGSDGDGDCSEPIGGTALMVGYLYSSTGALAEVDKLDSNGNPVRALWQATDETPFGQVDREFFDATATPAGSMPDGSGAAFSVADTYDTATDRLTGTTATAVDTSGGQTALMPSYSWDAYNNLLSRNVSETVPAGQTGSPTLNEDFAYDAVNRLCDVSSAPTSCSATSMMQYDSIGSLQFNGAYTSYMYGDGNNTSCNYTWNYSQPHAVASVDANGTTRSFCYDQDGNLVSESGDVNRTVTPTSYNKPYQIISNGTTATFTYGPSRERIMTTVMSATDTVTTTYIDGLFEQVTDSASGNTTYKHYILAGSARVGVESIQADSSGAVTADTLSFYVHDEVGSVIATATEGLGGVNQTLAVYSYDVWGKARTATGTGAYADPAPGSFLPDAQVMAGQHEGYADHEDIEDIGLVDMEGRVYDPEVGRFLSPDPNVQYPDSSQGYNRYTYVGDNPLSMSDPSGYFAGNQVAGIAAAILVTWACDGTCSAYTSAFLAGAADGYVSSGGSFRQAGISGMEAMAFTYVGQETDAQDLTAADTIGRSVTEGIIAGDFNVAGGGDFGDGFIGAFAGSESSSMIGEIGGNPYKNANYFSPVYESTRVMVTAIVGGTVSELTGGDFSDAAVAGAFQRLFNDDEVKNKIDKIPSKLMVERDKTISVGSYFKYFYLLENVKGQVLTDAGYGLEEFLWNDEAHTQSANITFNSEGKFVESSTGELMDRVGYTEDGPNNTSVTIYQTFKASYEGKSYDLTTELEHIIVVEPSIYRANSNDYINTVEVIHP